MEENEVSNEVSNGVSTGPGVPQTSRVFFESEKERLREFPYHNTQSILGTARVRRQWWNEAVWQ
jgi:hypothetical protein